MINPSYKPEGVWGSAAEVKDAHVETEEPSQYGCGYCLADGIDAPLFRVYLYGGSSFCAKHYRIVVLKQEPSE